MFIISPKIDDLTHTSLTLTVYDHEAIRSDEIIGQVCHMASRSHDHEAIMSEFYVPYHDFK